MTMDNFSKAFPLNGQGNREERRAAEDPLPSVYLDGANNFGGQRVPPQNFSLSSFMASSSFFRTTETTAASTLPSESIYQEAARLRIENARLKIENSQMAWAPQRIAEQDGQIIEQNKRILALEQENGVLKQSVKDLNKESTLILQGFVEKSSELNDSWGEEIDQLIKYVEDQKNSDHEVSEQQMQRKAECWQTFIKILHKREDKSLKLEKPEVEEKIVEESSTSSNIRKRADDQEAVAPKRSRRVASYVPAPAVELEERSNDGSNDASQLISNQQEPSDSGEFSASLD